MNIYVFGHVYVEWANLLIKIMDKAHESTLAKLTMDISTTYANHMQVINGKCIVLCIELDCICIPIQAVPFHVGCLVVETRVYHVLP